MATSSTCIRQPSSRSNLKLLGNPVAPELSIAGAKEGLVHLEPVSSNLAREVVIDMLAGDGLDKVSVHRCRGSIQGSSNKWHKDLGRVDDAIIVHYRKENFAIFWVLDELTASSSAGWSRPPPRSSVNWIYWMDNYACKVGLDRIG